MTPNAKKLFDYVMKDLRNNLDQWKFSCDELWRSFTEENGKWYWPDTTWLLLVGCDSHGNIRVGIDKDSGYLHPTYVCDNNKEYNEMIDIWSKAKKDKAKKEAMNDADYILEKLKKVGFIKE